MEAYGATAEETNRFALAEQGEQPQQVKPMLAPVFVLPLRSRAKRRRRSGGLLLAGVLAVVVVASKLALHTPRAALENIGGGVRGAAAKGAVRGRAIPPREDAASHGADASDTSETAAPAAEDPARRNLRIFLNERTGGAPGQRDGVGSRNKGQPTGARARSRRRAMQHLKSLKNTAPTEADQARRNLRAFLDPHDLKALFGHRRPREENERKGGTPGPRNRRPKNAFFTRDANRRRAVHHLKKTAAAQHARAHHGHHAHHSSSYSA